MAKELSWCFCCCSRWIMRSHMQVLILLQRFQRCVDSLQWSSESCYNNKSDRQTEEMRLIRWAGSSGSVCAGLFPLVLVVHSRSPCESSMQDANLWILLWRWLGSWIFIVIVCMHFFSLWPKWKETEVKKTYQHWAFAVVGFASLHAGHCSWFWFMLHEKMNAMECSQTD